MPQVQAASNIQATAEEIFAFLAEYSNIPRLQPHFASARLVSDKETGVGATVELKGHFHGIPMTATNRIITYSPPYRLVSISEGNVLSRNTWELRPSNSTTSAETHVTLTVEYKINGPLGGLFTGVASSLFHKELQSLTEQSLIRLQEIFAADS
ncbi:MAG: SRPBCC family protein [Chloroflexota bacterium]